jgi:Phage protein (N4 Gp49/phage Sf6 gene 66) family
MSLKATDQECAAVAVAPRVPLIDIEAQIAGCYYTHADMALDLVDVALEHIPKLALMTVCFLVMKNGYVQPGFSACASPENFNAALGKKLAREDAIRKLWPLLGYELKSRLANEDRADQVAARAAAEAARSSPQ